MRDDVDLVGVRRAGTGEYVVGGRSRAGWVALFLRGEGSEGGREVTRGSDSSAGEGGSGGENRRRGGPGEGRFAGRGLVGRMLARLASSAKAFVQDRFSEDEGG